MKSWHKTSLCTRMQRLPSEKMTRAHGKLRFIGLGLGPAKEVDRTPLGDVECWWTSAVMSFPPLFLTFKTPLPAGFFFSPNVCSNRQFWFCLQTATTCQDMS